MTYKTYDIVAHATRLYQAGREGELRHFIDRLESSDLLPVKEALPWLHQLSLGSSNSISEELPLEVSARSKGWRAYFTANYIEADKQFKHSIAQKGWQDLAYDSALGMAKVYTRSGHWQCAKDWVLYYLSLARDVRDDYGLVKGYGALAEIFLRSNNPKEALACFQIANQMMPSGQGQLDKQYNYIASALIRNGEYLRAETLLRNSLKLSREKIERDEKDSVAKASYLHSYSRLCFLKVAKLRPIHLASEVRQLLDKVHEHGARIPAGFINVALMIDAKNKAESVLTQLNYLAQAEQCFAQIAPMELLWVHNLKAKLQTNQPDKQNDKQQVKHNMQNLSATAYELLDLEPETSPKTIISVDKTWQQKNLSNAGYQDLRNSDLDLDDMIQMWQLFFI